MVRSNRHDGIYHRGHQSGFGVMVDIWNDILHSIFAHHDFVV